MMNVRHAIGIPKSQSKQNLHVKRFTSSFCSTLAHLYGWILVGIQRQKVSLDAKCRPMRRRFKLGVLSGTNFLCRSCFSLKRRPTHVLSDGGEPTTLLCNLIMQNKPWPISCEIVRAMKLLFIRYRTSLLALQSRHFFIPMHSRDIKQFPFIIQST